MDAEVGEVVEAAPVCGTEHQEESIGPADVILQVETVCLGVLE